MVTGSILNNDVKNAIVWGCGLAFSTDIVPQKKAIRAVRGKLTGDILKRQGVEFNHVYGDPALLLPKIYMPQVPKQWKLGILPHYSDTLSIYQRLNMSDVDFAMHGIRVLDIMSNVEDVINQINSCEKILSSTLHGLMVSHAYGVPCEWTKFSDKIIGDDFKYLDYFSSIESDKKSFMDLRGDKLNMLMLNTFLNYNNFYLPLMKCDLNALWNSCPFK